MKKNVMSNLNTIATSTDAINALKELFPSMDIEGTFAEVMGVDYDAPSYGDLANADEIVPDDVIFREYEGVCFVPDDFFCTTSAN
jgi:hypothetical protein